MNLFKLKIFFIFFYINVRRHEIIFFINDIPTDIKNICH